MSEGRSRRVCAQALLPFDLIGFYIHSPQRGGHLAGRVVDPTIEPHGSIPFVRKDDACPAGARKEEGHKTGLNFSIAGGGLFSIKDEGRLPL